MLDENLWDELGGFVLLSSTREEWKEWCFCIPVKLHSCSCLVISIFKRALSSMFKSMVFSRSYAVYLNSFDGFNKTPIFNFDLLSLLIDLQSKSLASRPGKTTFYLELSDRWHKGVCCVLRNEKVFLKKSCKSRSSSQIFWLYEDQTYE